MLYYVHQHTHEANLRIPHAAKLPMNREALPVGYARHVPLQAQIPKMVNKWFLAVANETLKKLSKHGHRQKEAGPGRTQSYPNLAKYPPGSHHSFTIFGICACKGTCLA